MKRTLPVPRPPFRAPSFSYLLLRRRAAEFLERFHPSGAVPVPIEAVAEFGLGLSIVPVRGLRAEFGVDGFLTADLAEIRVDRSLFSAVPNRCRFTLAHEIGHLVLHGPLLREWTGGGARPFRTISAWRAFLVGLPPAEVGWLEYHAATFAGLALVPPAALAREAPAILASLPRRGGPFDGSAFRRELAAALALRFEVSEAVILRRLAREGMQPPEKVPPGSGRADRPP